MGTHYIPRNVKGEGRILFIFSPRSLIFSVITGIVGFLISLILKPITTQIMSIFIILCFASIGFIVSTVKIPKNNSPKLQEFSGYRIDEIFVKYIKFKKKSNRIYVYREPKAEEE